MDAVFWDEVERSRKLTGAQRMSESLRLFDEEARRICAERLEIIRRLESLP